MVVIILSGVIVGLVFALCVQVTVIRMLSKTADDLSDELHEQRVEANDNHDAEVSMLQFTIDDLRQQLRNAHISMSAVLKQTMEPDPEEATEETPEESAPEDTQEAEPETLIHMD